MQLKSINSLFFSLIVFLTSSGTLAGASTAADRATARQLMLEGRNLRYDGNLKDALVKFRAADALMGVPTTGLELARTEAALGMLIEALDTCSRVIRYPTNPNEPEPFQEARRDARKLRDELRQRTPMLRFVFPSREDMDQGELRVGGVLVPREARLVPHLVNPGTHRIDLIFGSHRHQVLITISEGETKEVMLTLPRSTVHDTQSIEEDKVEEDKIEPWVWGGFTTAAIGGAIGSVAGVLAWSERKRLDDECPNRTCPNGSDRLDSAYRYANVSTYAFIAGGIGASVGIGALLLSGSDDQEAEAGVRVMPCGGAVCLNGRF